MHLVSAKRVEITSPCLIKELNASDLHVILDKKLILRENVKNVMIIKRVL